MTERTADKLGWTVMAITSLAFVGFIFYVMNAVLNEACRCLMETFFFWL